MTINFIDAGPPERFRDWTDTVTALEANPGKWAMLETERLSVATAIRQGDVAPLHKDKGFEIRTAKTDREAKPPVCDLYLRYLPSADTRLIPGRKTDSLIRAEKKNTGEDN